MSARTGQSSPGSTLRLSLGCELREVRATRLAVRTFLRARGLIEAELAACELALAEACNNAVQYVRQGCRHERIEVLVRCTPVGVELRVEDHTAGFDWPKRVSLPASDRETGRGLFFIQYLMDRTRYSRTERGNQLIMLKQLGRYLRHASAGRLALKSGPIPIQGLAQPGDDLDKNPKSHATDSPTNRS